MRRVACLLVGSLAVAASAHAAASVPTFSKDVAPIVFNTCATCPRAGEVAPMTLTSYDDVRPWAKVIKNKVVSREMPPWGADPAHSLKMRNDRSLTQAQIDTIVAWVDGGAPKGSDADLPPMPTFAEGWTFGREPDAILEMPVTFSRPAEGELGVQMFYSKVPWSEDRFAETLEIRPGNRAVVHHLGVFGEGWNREGWGRSRGVNGSKRRKDAEQQAEHASHEASTCRADLRPACRRTRRSTRFPDRSLAHLAAGTHDRDTIVTEVMLSRFSGAALMNRPLMTTV